MGPPPRPLSPRLSFFFLLESVIPVHSVSWIEFRTRLLGSVVGQHCTSSLWSLPLVGDSGVVGAGVGQGVGSTHSIGVVGPTGVFPFHQVSRIWYLVFPGCRTMCCMLGHVRRARGYLVTLGLASLNPTVAGDGFA